jgi:multiple sugar transport system substrate-binding protein
MTGTSLTHRASSETIAVTGAVTGTATGTARRVGLAAATVAVALLASAAPGLAQKLTVWSGYPEMAPFYAHVAESMKAKYPKLEVSVEAIPLREHEKRVALGLTSGGSGTLVIELPASTANRYLSNDLLPKAPANVAAFVNDAKNFDPFFRDQVTFGGAVVATPLFRGQGALFYNTDMFKAAGLTKPPATMADFDAYAAKLTQHDATGKATVSGWSLRLSGGGQGIAEKFWINMFQFGGNLLTPFPDGKWKVTVAGEAGQKALKQYLHNVHVAKTVTPEMPADADAFERGQTAMFIRESWVIGDIAKKAPTLAYATAPLPVGSIALPANLYVSAKGADADVAWAFTLAANEPDNLVWLLKNVGWLPNRSGVDYTPVTSTVPALAAFVDYPKGYKFFTLPAIDPIEEILTRVAARLTAAFADPKLAGDDAAIAKFLAETEAQANAILSREGLLAK